MNRARKDMLGLVVEDEFLLRLELVEELGRAGWQVVEAASGEEAVNLLQTNPDFLISDIRLPGAIDGWQVAEAARRHNPQIPVIYVSANPIDAKRRVPGSAFLGKPVDISTLLRLCDALVLKE
jgi:CheY-like chemotaxis protein